MTLLEAALDPGLEFHAPFYDNANPVDFALTADGRTITMFAGWWKAAWGPGDGFESFNEPCVPEIVPIGSEPSVWTVQDIEGVEFRFASDAEMAARIKRNRDRADVDRHVYMTALRNLREDFAPVFDITPWVEAIEARPVIDAVEELRKQNLGLRKVGRLFLRDSHGGSDVLVIDEFGNTAVASGSEWLEVFADQWSGREDRPDMEDFLAWAQEQRVPIAASFEGAQIEMTAGHVEDIAARILAGKSLDTVSRKARKGTGQTTVAPVGFAS